MLLAGARKNHSDVFQKNYDIFFLTNTKAAAAAKEEEPFFKNF